MAGNSLNQDELKVTEADTDITYYYQVKSDQPEETPTMTPTVTPDAVPTAPPTITPSEAPMVTLTVAPSATPIKQKKGLKKRQIL